MQGFVCQNSQTNDTDYWVDAAAYATPQSRSIRVGRALKMWLTSRTCARN